jgi:hypothetical protein
MSALFLLNALFFFRFFFHGNLSVDDVQRDPANFVAMFIGNEDGVVPVLQLWAFLEQPLGECRRGVHCRNVVRQFHSTFIANRIGIDKVEVIEGHCFSRRTLLDLLPAGAFFQSMKLPLVLSLLVQVCCPGRWSVAPFAFRPTAPLRALIAHGSLGGHPRLLGR